MFNRHCKNKKQNEKRLEEYYKYRPGIETADLIEFKSNTLIGGAIRLVTGKPVNHTAVAIRLKRYTEERVFLLEALEMGITLNLLSRRLSNFNGEAYLLRLKTEYAIDRNPIGKAALNFVGTGYDYLSILKQITGRVSADARRLFCSEFAYLSLLDAKLPVHRDKAPVPGEMYDLGVFEKPTLIFSSNQG